MTDYSNLTGLDSLLRKMEAVKYDIKRKGGRAALRKGGQVVVNAAKQNAAAIDDPATASVIKYNIAMRWNGKLFKATGNLGFRIGVLGGAKEYANTKANVRAGVAGTSYTTGGDASNPGGDTWHWRHVEFGTERTPAQPILRPALSDNVGLVTSTFITEYEKNLDKAIKKAGG